MDFLITFTGDNWNGFKNFFGIFEIGFANILKI